MKKLLTLVLTLTMAVTFAAYGNSGSVESSSSAAPSQTESPASIAEESSSSSPTESQAEASSQPEGSSQTEEENSGSGDASSVAEESSQPEAEADSSSLVVYFSWSGNTESVADEIQAQTGADIFRIVPAEPYTDDYNTLLDIAQREQANDARPAIAGSVENFDQYDVVYLGYPNWWGDMPMILYTLLDEYDFSGKTIAPFVTSGGSGFSGTIRTIEGMEPGATVTEGLSLGSSEAANPGGDVTAWLSSIGLAG